MCLHDHDQAAKRAARNKAALRDERMGTGTGMCMDMCVDVCTDTLGVRGNDSFSSECIDVRVDMCIGMCVDM